MQTTGTMFNRVWKFGQSFDSSGEYSLWTLECFKPFEAVMICSEYNFIAQKIISEVLQWCDNGEKFSACWTIVSLCRIHDSREKMRWAFLTSNDLRERAAPITTSLASVSRMQGMFGYGNDKVEVSIRACFSLSKACWASSVQTNFVPYFVSLVKVLRLWQNPWQICDRRRRGHRMHARHVDSAVLGIL